MQGRRTAPRGFDTLRLSRRTAPTRFRTGWSPAEIERQAAIKARTCGELVQRKNISLD